MHDAFCGIQCKPNTMRNCPPPPPPHQKKATNNRLCFDVKPFDNPTFCQSTTLVGITSLTRNIFYLCLCRGSAKAWILKSFNFNFTAGSWPHLNFVSFVIYILFCLLVSTDVIGFLPFVVSLQPVSFHFIAYTCIFSRSHNECGNLRSGLPFGVP